jgi:hypothetical protein
MRSPSSALVHQRQEATQDSETSQIAIVDLLRNILLAVSGCTLILNGIDEYTTMCDYNSSIVKFLEYIDKIA